MRASKFSYYSDFVVYPIVVIGLVAANMPHLTRHRAEEWVTACVTGMVLWTFLEYLLHRLALHWMPVFSPMHSQHHGAPLAYLATPSWISVSVWLGVIMVPFWWYMGFNVANGLTVGVMVGYWWYGYVHHVIHHHARKPSAYFSELRAWHMRHHHSPKLGNFGVTTRFWDHVFGTTISAQGKAVVSP